MRGQEYSDSPDYITFDQFASTFKACPELIEHFKEESDEIPELEEYKPSHTPSSMHTPTSSLSFTSEHDDSIDSFGDKGKNVYYSPNWGIVEEDEENGVQDSLIEALHKFKQAAKMDLTTSLDSPKNFDFDTRMDT